VGIRQTLSGIDYNDYLKNKDVYEEVLISTYSSLLGVQPSEIKGLTVIQVSATRMRRRLLTPSVAVSFSVVTNSPYVSLQTLSSTLAAATLSSTLTDKLQAQASNHALGVLAR